MTEKEFYLLVDRMRNMQKEYFKRRNKAEECQSILIASKALEKQVDNEIKLFTDKDKPKQGTLL